MSEPFSVAGIRASVISNISGDNEEDSFVFNPSSIPLYPLTDGVVFPGQPLPVPVANEHFEPFLQNAMESGECVFCALERPNGGDGSKTKDYFPYGVIAKVGKLIKMGELPSVVFLIPSFRAKLSRVVAKDFPLRVSVKVMPPYFEPKKTSLGFTMMLKEISAVYNKIISFLPEDEKSRLTIDLKQIEHDPLGTVFFMANNSPVEFEAKAKMLGAEDMEKVLELALMAFNDALKKLEIRANIQRRTNQVMSDQQKRAFLEQQMKSIQNELNGSDELDEIGDLRKRASKLKWTKDAAAHFEKEVKKLEHFNPQSPDYATQYSYLETLLELPWDKYSKGNFNLERIREVLDRDHFGLDKVKERIIEHMAVLKLRKDLKAPIICLYGPPGVGKTSLGKSIADALGREYARVSLGGLHDEAEIRGHRRTYIGAMPGRIITALRKCGTGNPVFVLDEVDKIGNDYKGDPSTALLEVLDPEQNEKFHDNFVDFDYDLSKILFIATANDISKISRPLLDRMELMEIDGYIPDEKIEIAKRHLIPKGLEAHGFEPNEISFTDDSLRFIIDNYTRESGVRLLEKKIAKVLRKTAALKASGKDYPNCIDKDKSFEFLGKKEVSRGAYDDNSFAGVVTGLAWTSVGGEILFIETSLSPGNGEKLVLTGKLGDVMKESATIALQYLKAHAKEAGIDFERFSKANVHIHVPEGAVPKDGPSAGITMVTSLASAFTGRKVRDKIAMTGEITLRGKVLPVGGIKEKILAAKRAGITDVVLSLDNEKDILEISPVYLEGMEFHYVSTVLEALDFALLPELAPHRFEFLEG